MPGKQAGSVIKETQHHTAPVPKKGQAPGGAPCARGGDERLRRRAAGERF